MTVVSTRFDDLGADGAPARLGIMGGTFDPIHIGHLACAEQAREAFALDAVVFVPAGCPVYKKNQKVTDASRRLEMCQLAVANNPAFDVSALEVERPGDTYTVDTLRQLREHYPENVELFFITGADAVANIVRWRESGEVAGLARFIAVTRPGYQITEAHKRELTCEGRFSIDYLEVTELAVSSSGLRDRVRRGQSVRYLTMASVLAYIEEQGLYRERDARDVGSACGNALTGGTAGCGSAADTLSATVPAESAGMCAGVAPGTIPTADPGTTAAGTSEAEALTREFFDARESELRTRVKKKRFSHVMGVVDMAQTLAHAYDVDVRRARLAALLHDWDKDYDDDEIRDRAREVGLDVDPWVFVHMPRLLHGPTAALALAREFPCIPPDVLQAIDRHTTGSPDMSPLDMVLYVADALEAGRTFGRVAELRARIGQASLEELFVDVLGYWTVLILERGRTLHPQTVEVWNAYASKREKPYMKNAATA